MLPYESSSRVELLVKPSFESLRTVTLTLSNKPLLDSTHALFLLPLDRPDDPATAYFVSLPPSTLVETRQILKCLHSINTSNVGLSSSSSCNNKNTFVPSFNDSIASAEHATIDRRSSRAVPQNGVAPSAPPSQAPLPEDEITVEHETIRTSSDEPDLNGLREALKKTAELANESMREARAERILMKRIKQEPIFDDFVMTSPVKNKPQLQPEQREQQQPVPEVPSAAAAKPTTVVSRENQLESRRNHDGSNHLLSLKSQNSQEPRLVLSGARIVPKIIQVPVPRLQTPILQNHFTPRIQANGPVTKPQEPLTNGVAREVPEQIAIPALQAIPAIYSRQRSYRMKRTVDRLGGQSADTPPPTSQSREVSAAPANIEDRLSNIVLPPPPPPSVPLPALQATPARSPRHVATVSAPTTTAKIARRSGRKVAVESVEPAITQDELDLQVAEVVQRIKDATRTCPKLPPRQIKRRRRLISASPSPKKAKRSRGGGPAAPQVTAQLALQSLPPVSAPAPQPVPVSLPAVNLPAAIQIPAALPVPNSSQQVILVPVPIAVQNGVSHLARDNLRTRRMSTPIRVDVESLDTPEPECDLSPEMNVAQAPRPSPVVNGKKASPTSKKPLEQSGLSALLSAIEYVTKGQATTPNGTAAGSASGARLNNATPQQHYSPLSLEDIDAASASRVSSYSIDSLLSPNSAAKSV